MLVTAATLVVQKAVGARLEERPWAAAFSLVAIGGIFVSARASSRARDAVAFAGSCAYLAGMLASVAASLHPIVLPARPDLARSLTVESAASPEYGLGVALGWWVPGTALAAVYFAIVYFRFPLRSILFIPVQLLEVLVALVIPLAVLAELAIRRLGRQLLEGVTAAVVAVALNEALRFVIVEWASTDLADGLSIRVNGDLVVSLPPVFAMVLALLTVAGPRGRRRTVDWSWNVVWISAAVLSQRLPPRASRRA